MWRIILFLLYLNNVFANKEKTRIVILDEGGVIGTKYWDGDFYEFYGIPYAKAPTGRDRFQAPLPVEPWNSIFDAKDSKIVCHQSYFTEENGDEFILSGESDCLVINIFAPEVASEDNLVPVVVYIHSGAFAGGSGSMARFHFLARHDIIVISFNYRLGGIGFACLGTKEIPGNAALKDQVAALKWINKNIVKFGGDPNKVTLAGYSVGASMAELLMLSKATDGLIHQLILESGSALSPFAINRDPIATAKNLALGMGYNGTGTIEDITEFYLNVSDGAIAAISLNFFLPNSTFGYSPCIENVHDGIEPFLTESPLDILKKGQHKKIPIMTGFSNMEGISRTIKFGSWKKRMNEDFSNFLPVDLAFDSEKSRQDFIKEVKDRYFPDGEITSEHVQNYINYFSDAMFKYSIMKSLRLQAASTNLPIYFYEFSYVGKLNMQHNFMDRIKGASHRDQTAYVLDFYGWTNSYKDLDMRDRMTAMWADFVKYGDPTAYESALINYKWLPYTNKNLNYLQISKRQTMKKNLFIDEYNFWDKVYKKYYWNPTAPKPIYEKVDDKDEVKEALNKDKIEANKSIDKETKKDAKESKQETRKKSKEVNDEKQDVKVEQGTINNAKAINKDTKPMVDNTKKETKESTEERKEELKVVNNEKKEDTKSKQDTVNKATVVNKEAKSVVEDSKKDMRQSGPESKNDPKVDSNVKKEDATLKQDTVNRAKVVNKENKRQVTETKKEPKESERERNKQPKTSNDAKKENNKVKDAVKVENLKVQPKDSKKDTVKEKISSDAKKQA